MLNHEKLLSPRRSSTELWNSRRVADSSFLSESNMDSFMPHSVYGVVPGDVLDSFIEKHAGPFSSATQLKTRLESADCTKSAEEVVQRMCLAQSSYGFEGLEINQAKRKTATFLTCPLVWDTGSGHFRS